ncbi:unnamed protein product, partial [Polarella glacialis]
DDDTWLAATLTEVREDGTRLITWEEGSVSEVAADYVRGIGGEGAEEAAEGAEVEGWEEPAAEAEDPAAAAAAAAAAEEMEALMAAAEAAGACDEADAEVAGHAAPCAMFWGAALSEQEAPGTEQKRERPLGLMSSAKALEMCLEAKRAKKGGR